MREELNWPGLYTDLGSVPLAAGEHLVRIRYETGGWHPGSGGTPYAFGPAALSLVDAREPVIESPPRAPPPLRPAAGLGRGAPLSSQNNSGHHGSRSARKSASARATAPGCSSSRRCAHRSCSKVKPPR